MIALALSMLLSQAPAGQPEPPRAEPEQADAAQPEAAAAAPAAEERAEIDKAFAEEAPRPVKVTLNNGRVVTGKLLLRDDLQMLIETEDGQPVTIDVENVKRYEEPLPNRNRSRYLFGASALMPDPGQITLTQAQVFVTLFEVGISPNFSFQLGGSLPAYFLGGDGVNAFAGVKAGTSFNRYVHFALELKLLALGLLTHNAGPATAVPAVGLAALTVTFGTEDLNLTVSGGPPINLAQLSAANGRVVGLPLFTVSGFARVHTNVGLVTENWVVPDYDAAGHWFVADALAARFFGAHLAVDLGLIVMPTQFYVQTPVPAVLPWLNFTYHFS